MPFTHTTGSDRPTRGQLLFGPNFSGRSAALREILQRFDRRFAIGPNPADCFSGLVASAQEETMRFARSPQAATRALELIETMGMSHVLSQNPFTLSGGQQSVMALGSGVAAEPVIIGADCCFEQLDQELRPHVYANAIQASGASLVAADNRVLEYDAPELLEKVIFHATAETRAARLDHDVMPVRPIDSAPLELRDVTVRYRQGFSLRIPELRLQAGRVYRLEGRNGAGKTTFARLLCGLLPLRQGTIRYGGARVNLWRHPGSLVAMAFQNPDHQLFSHSIHGELLARLAPDEIGRLVLRALGVNADVATHPGSLPFVLRKRLSLAAALASSRPWYILDEPTLGQDDHSVYELARIVTRMAANGAGIIAITHSERFVSLLSPHRLLVQGGQVCQV